MARVSNTPSTSKRRKKVIKQAKGYFGAKSKLFKKAKEQVMKSLFYAYRDRKQVKRDYRKLWIARINAATRQYGLSYSRFIDGLNKADIKVNRKMLSEIAIHNEKEFKLLVDASKKSLAKQNAQKI